MHGPIVHVPRLTKLAPHLVLSLAVAVGKMVPNVFRVRRNKLVPQAVKIFGVMLARLALDYLKMLSDKICGKNDELSSVDSDLRSGSQR